MMEQPPHEDPSPADTETPERDATALPTSFFDRLTPARWLVFSLGLLLLYQIATVLLWNGRSGIGLLGLAAAPMVSIALPIGLLLRSFGLSFLKEMQLQVLSAKQVLGVVLSTIGILPIAYALSVFNARYVAPVPEYWEFFEALRPNDPIAFLCGLTAVVIAVPLGEELLFRRLVQGVLSRHLSVGVAILLTGVLFGAAHMTPWVLLPISSLGIMLGVLAARSATITAPWLAHALFNLFSFLELTLTGDPESSDFEAVIVRPVPVLLGAVLIWWGIRLSTADGKQRNKSNEPADIE
jgi:membrane protease YdiL (CAAX protease family)